MDYYNNDQYVWALAKSSPDEYYTYITTSLPNTRMSCYENRLPKKLKTFSKYSVLIIRPDWLFTKDVQGTNLFFQLIAKRIFTSNKPFSQWNEVFADKTIVAAILDRVLNHYNVINIRGESYRFKERKEHMRTIKKVNTLFEND